MSTHIPSNLPHQQGPEQPMVTSAEERAMLRAVRQRQALLGFQNGVLRVVFVALAILRLDDRIHVTWWVVFTPLWLFFAGQFLGLCVERTLAARLKESLAEAALAAGRDPEAPMPPEEEVGLCWVGVV